MKFFKKKKTKNSGIIEIYGLHAVSAALNNPKRKHKKLVISQSHTGMITREIKKNVKEIIVLSKFKVGNP